LSGGLTPALGQTWDVLLAARLNPPYPSFFPIYDKIFLVGGNTAPKLFLSALSLGEYAEPNLQVVIPGGVNFPFGWGVDPD